MNIPAPKSITSNRESISWFCRLLNTNATEEIVIDFTDLSFFRGNLCSILSAIIDYISERIELRIINLDNENVFELFSRNGMTEKFGLEKTFDQRGTVIENKVFSRGQGSEFIGYYYESYKHDLLPEMTHQLKNKFDQSICEIFENASTHSETNKIYTCGQHFPHDKVLSFTIVDLGIGFDGSFRKHKGIEIDSNEAIKRALSGESTKDKPGGLGLTLIKEFIELNNGSLEIISKTTYWKYERKKGIFYKLHQPFPGTIVTIDVKTNDTNAYCLADENL